MIAVVSLHIIAAVCAVLAIVCYRHWHIPAARPLLLLMVGLVIWTSSFAAEIILPDLEAKLVTVKVQYIGIVSLPIAWIIFARRFGQAVPSLGRRSGLLLWIIPAITLSLVWTSEQHGLFYQRTWLEQTELFGPMLRVSYGPAFWLHTLYSYTLMLIGSGLLVQAMIRSSIRGRSQLIGPLIGAFIPWIGNAIYLAGWAPLDITPFAFATTGAVWTWSLFRSRILDLIPIARDEVLESMSDGVIVIDDQNRVLDINKAALEMIARSRSDVMKRRLSETLPEYAELILRYQPVNKTSEEIEVHHPEQPTRWFTLQIAPIRDRLNQQAGRLIVLNDITQLKQNEAILRAARDAAEHASRTKSAFLMNVSHELRTPLNAIIGYSELLLMATREHRLPELTTDVEQIHRSGTQLLHMIRDVLDLTQLEAGTLHCEPRPIDIAPFLRHLFASIEPLMSKQQNTLVVTIAADLGVFCTDAEKLSRMLTHLLDNATKFTEHGRISVAVSRTTLAHRAAICFQISDTGSGLTLESVDELFQPFAQGDMSATRRHGGMGLGLSIVNQFCILLGGTISVESTPDHGSTFTLTLPDLDTESHPSHIVEHSQEQEHGNYSSR